MPGDWPTAGSTSGGAAVVLDQEHVLAGLDQLPTGIVNSSYPPTPAVDAELSSFPWDVALDTQALCKFGLLDQVAGRQEELGVAVDECQQACPLTVALEQFQGGEDAK
jgi:hypothetical protein